MCSSLGRRGMPSVVVTSTVRAKVRRWRREPALRAAQSGHRVVLFDRYLRKPRVHEMFDRPWTGRVETMVVRAKATKPCTRVASRGWAVACRAYPAESGRAAGSNVSKISNSGSVRLRLDHCSPPVIAVTDPSIWRTRPTAYLRARLCNDGSAWRSVVDRPARVFQRAYRRLHSEPATSADPYYYRSTTAASTPTTTHPLPEAPAAASDSGQHPTSLERLLSAATAVSCGIVA